MCYITSKPMNRSEIFQSLDRFRKGLLQILIVLVCLCILVFPFSKTFLRYLQRSNLQTDLVAFGIPEAFLSTLKLTLFVSLFLSVPIIFYRLWKSFAPLFRLNDSRSMLPLFLISLLLFYLGASFCYFVTLPFGIRFLLGYQSAYVKPMISVERYISFCAVFTFAFGITFELPLVLALLSYLKMVTARFLTKNRRYAILLIAILSAVVTPTPDVFNMGLMGGPLYVLFEIGVLMVKIIEAKRVRAESRAPSASP